MSPDELHSPPELGLLHPLGTATADRDAVHEER